MMKNFSPVLICTLNRHRHFKSCVESLAACTYADQTDLFIGFDYPLKEAHWEGYKIIKDYLPNIKGFKAVNIVEREKNYGVNDNWLNMQNHIFTQFDRIILSEDDNVFAPTFLKFMNKGLNAYENREDIFAITGYNSPLPMPNWYKQDVYLLNAFPGWGVGGWRGKWEKVDWSLESFTAMLSNKENYNFIKKYYPSYLSQLLRIRDTGYITGDGFLFLYLLQNKMYSICPTKTRVRNIGFDGSGVNCGQNNTIYLNQELYEGSEEPNFPLDIRPDPKLIRYKSQQLRPSLIEKIWMKIPPHGRVFLKKCLRRKRRMAANL
jgi:hypothetical protein